MGSPHPPFRRPTRFLGPVERIPRPIAKLSKWEVIMRCVQAFGW